jgi:hypothetical protein
LANRLRFPFRDRDWKIFISVVKQKIAADFGASASLTARFPTLWRRLFSIDSPDLHVRELAVVPSLPPRQCCVLCVVSSFAHVRRVRLPLGFTQCCVVRVLCSRAGWETAMPSRVSSSSSTPSPASCEEESSLRSAAYDCVLLRSGCGRTTK